MILDENELSIVAEAVKRVHGDITFGISSIDPIRVVFSSVEVTPDYARIRDEVSAIKSAQ